MVCWIVFLDNGLVLRFEKVENDIAVGAQAKAANGLLQR